MCVQPESSLTPPALWSNVSGGNLTSYWSNKWGAQSHPPAVIGLPQQPHLKHPRPARTVQKSRAASKLVELPTVTSGQGMPVLLQLSKQTGFLSLINQKGQQKYVRNGVQTYDSTLPTRGTAEAAYGWWGWKVHYRLNLLSPRLHPS